MSEANPLDRLVIELAPGITIIRGDCLARDKARTATKVVHRQGNKVLCFCPNKYRIGVEAVFGI